MNGRFSHLRIERFRGLRDVELADLRRVSVIVGPNDTGKTSILEAISLLAHPLDPAAWVTAGRREASMFARTRMSQLERFRWMFPRGVNEPDAEELLIRLGATGPLGERTVSTTYRDVKGIPPPSAARWSGVREKDLEEERSGAEEGDLDEERSGAEVVIELKDLDQIAREEFTYWEYAPFATVRRRDRFAIPSQVITPFDHMLRGTPARWFSQARLAGYQNSVAELLEQLDPRIHGLEVLAPAGEGVLYVRDERTGLAPVSVYGDGIRRAILFASILPSLEGGILLIDEVETALHVSALSAVFRWLVEACRSFDVQLFVTTHSLEAVDAILDADLSPEEDTVGFKLELKDGHVSARRYGEELLKRMRHDRGLDVR